jgi:hypothetical protein
MWIALAALVAAASVPVLHSVRDEMAQAGSWSDDPTSAAGAPPELDYRG